MDDRETTRAVAVRMRIAIARLAMRRPARVCDARRAFQQRRKLPLQLTHFAFGLVHAELVVARAGDARRVIAAIFESMQPFHQDGARVALADVTDDSAHALRSPKSLAKALLSLRFRWRKGAEALFAQP